VGESKVLNAHVGMGHTVSFTFGFYGRIGTKKERFASTQLGSLSVSSDSNSYHFEQIKQK